MTPNKSQTNRLTKELKHQGVISDPVNKKVNLINGVLTFLFIGTLALTVYEINIYRMTLISWQIPTSIWILTGLLVTPFTLAKLSEYYKTHNLFLHLVFNICTWGGIVLCTFMIVNYKFPDSTKAKIKASVFNTGHLARGKSGCEVPYAEVRIKEMDKQLMFPCDFNIEKYKFIDVTIQKGFFGFFILTDKTALVD